PALAIPATLHDSLMARLDRLGTAKAVAQYAAVLGRHFSYAVLHAVSQVDEPTLQRALDRLVDAELLYQRGLPPQTPYFNIVRRNLCMVADLSDATVRDGRSTPSHWPTR